MRRLTWLLLALMLATAALLSWRHGRGPDALAPAAAATRTPPLAGLRIEPAFPKLEFDRPLFLTHAPGDAGHVYVVTQAGVIHRFEQRPDIAKSEVFLDIRKDVSTAGQEEGLLGLAFDPGYVENRYFYVYYSAASPRRSVIRRLRAGSPESAVLLELPDPYANHNGGWIAFGPDRKLYVAIGDGGSGNDPENRAQNLDVLFGKILRLNSDGSAAQDNPFSKPVQCSRAPCPPFDTAQDRAVMSPVWAWGLRNPWRCAFDRADGALWCGDVGQNAIEEIDIVRKGGNYGWRLYEGTRSNINPERRPASDFVAPVYEYDHSLGCSITGGYVYRGSAVPTAVGRYFYADFCSGHVWALLRDANNKVTNNEIGNLQGPSSFGEDAAGELYITSFDGHIYRLAAAP